jgi:hypothetical protein
MCVTLLEMGLRVRSEEFFMPKIFCPKRRQVSNTYLPNGLWSAPEGQILFRGM